MKNSVIVLFIFSAFLSNAQKDSTYKGPKFIYELTVAPNLSSDIKNFGYYLDKGYFKSKHISLGGSFYIKLGAKFKSSSLTAGFGISQYSYKIFGSYSYVYSPSWSGNDEWMDNYSYQYLKVPVNYTIYLGKNKKWFTGLSLELAYLIAFEEKFNEHLSSTENGRYIEVNLEYSHKQNDCNQLNLFGGLEIGREFKIKNNLHIKLSLDAKCSSFVRTNMYYAPAEVYGRNLFVTSLNIGLLFR